MLQDSSKAAGVPQGGLVLALGSEQQPDNIDLAVVQQRIHQAAHSEGAADDRTRVDNEVCKGGALLLKPMHDWGHIVVDDDAGARPIGLRVELGRTVRR